MQKTILLSLLCVVVSGCNTLGQSQTDCPKNTSGAACLSAREIYDLTHVADRVEPNYKDGQRIKPSDEASAASSVGATQVGSAQANGHRPPLPEVDTPLPVRTPAKVMRIRIFPWEDNARDLHSGGYVYTEVETRTWTIGEEQVSRVQSNVISPLTPPARTSGATNLTPLQFTGSQGQVPAGRQVPPANPGQGVRNGQGQPAPLNSRNPN